MSNLIDKNIGIKSFFLHKMGKGNICKDDSFKSSMCIDQVVLIGCQVQFELGILVQVRFKSMIFQFVLNKGHHLNHYNVQLGSLGQVSFTSYLYPLSKRIGFLTCFNSYYQINKSLTYEE